MELWEHVFKPSSMIAILIALIFVIMAIVSLNSAKANTSFFEISKDAIKILAGALAGAVAGEKYSGGEIQNE